MPWGYEGVMTEARLQAAADYQLKLMFQEGTVYSNYLLSLEKAAAAGREARLAAAMAELRTASLAAGAADLAVTLGLPIAVWVGVFVALGAPYAQARALVRNENFQSGFSQGFVASLLNWQWRHITTRFFRFGPGQMNYFDESLSFIAANAYNEGLRAGFMSALSLNEKVRKAILHKLRSLSPSTKAGNWGRLDQISYVIELASAGRRNMVFRPS